MKLLCERIEDWPPLAWIARFSLGDQQLRLRHGRGVHTEVDWFCEAVWDGPFSKGDFDRTDLVFGSGGRQRDGLWTFVSSGSTVDRLHWHQSGDSVCVSNSLACLTASIQATVDPHRRDYFRFFESIIRGIESYSRSLETTAGPVNLTYFHNLVLGEDGLKEFRKPKIDRDLSTFEKYETFLIDSMSAIGENLSDKQREWSFEPIASISTGYDSPTTATAARHAGLKRSISIADARGGANDDGSEIARALGLEPIQIQRDRWRSGTHDVVKGAAKFIASDAKGEDVYFAAAVEELEGRVLFSGYAGSRIWDSTVADYSNIRRGDQSGLSHTEARVHAGYIHVPVPFFGSLQENDVRAIGRLPEMKAWNLESDYNRPVCRRIVEQAGVPREWFGQEKKAASVLLFDRESFLPKDCREAYQRWAREHRIDERTLFERAGRIARICGSKIVRCLQQMMQFVDSIVTLPVLSRISQSGRITELSQYEPEFDHIFPWALSLVQLEYLIDETDESAAKLLSDSDKQDSLIPSSPT